MRRFGEFVAAVALGAAALTLALAQPVRAAGVPALDVHEAITTSQAVLGTTPSDFTLLDREGRPVKLSSFRGKPLLVSFIYTGCFEVCPTQTRALHQAVRGIDLLLGSDQFNVVSIGFNQPFDHPKAMRAFAAQQRIQYPNWEFLAPHASIVEPLTRAYGFSYVATPRGFDHVVGVTVVDAQGRIFAQVYGEDVNTRELGQVLRELLLRGGEAVAPQRLTTTSLVADLVERVRVLCTVYDPATGTFRYDLTILWKAIGGSLFFFSVGVYLYREWRSMRRTRNRAATAP